MNYVSCNIQDFIDRTRDKQVLCFGGGSYFKVLCYDFAAVYPDIKLCGIIDNNSDKWGIKVSAAGFEAKVFSLGQALAQFDFSETVIVVTTASLSAVKAQLECLEELTGKDVYSYFEIKKNSVFPVEKLEINTDEPLIPSKIHYCWFSGSEIPAGLQKCIDSWKTFCPDYEIIRWDESNYDISKNEFMKEAYTKKKWGFVPDYARLDIVYNEGGFYFDTDVEMIKDIDALRYNYGFIGTELTGGINAGSGFGATKKHRALNGLMNLYEMENITDLLSESCVGRETSYFYSKGYNVSGKTQVVDGMTIYPYNVLSPKTYETGESNITDASFSVHHFDGSWR